MRSEAGPQGWGRSPAAWGWPRPGQQGRRGRRHLPFGLLGAVPLFSLFVFHLPASPQPSRLPLIVCRAIKGQMSGRSLAAAGPPRSEHRHGGGGWVAGGAWRVTRLTTSCTESFSEGRFAHGSQNPRSIPGKKVQLSPILQRKRPRSQKVGTWTRPMASGISNRPC